MAAPLPDRDAEAALALWASICAEPAGREAAWIEAPATPTLIPFDTLEIISGTAAIAWHLAARERNYGAARLECSPLAWWQEEGGLVVVAEAMLRHSAPTAPAEARPMILILGATTGGALRLRHVSEAVPAVLPLVIQTYRSSRAGPPQ